MKLGVVIVTYNRLNLLKECIEACLNQTYKFNKIIVVNNNSSDGTYEYLDKIKEKCIEIINLPENVGGAGGFCEGVKKITNYDIDYVLFIDDDAIINDDYNEIILKEMKKKNKDIVAYSGTVKTDNIIQCSHRRFLNSSKTYADTNSKAEDYENDYFDYDIFSFCGVYISMDIIKKVGNPNKDFFIWFDDSDYSLRVNKFGKIRNVNRANLNHKTIISTNKNSNITWKEYYGQRNLLYMVKTQCSRKLYKNTLKKKKIRMKIYFLKWLISRNIKYKNYYHIYKDAINDAINDKLGKNPKYLPK